MMCLAASYFSHLHLLQASSKMAEGSKTAQKEFVRVSPEEYASSLNDSSMEELVPDHIDAPVVMNGKQQ